MSTSAIVMMIVAMLIIWGGLVAAIIHLNRATTGMPHRSEVRRDL